MFLWHVNILYMECNVMVLRNVGFFRRASKLRINYLKTSQVKFIYNIYIAIKRHSGKNFNPLVPPTLIGEIDDLICLPWQKRHSVFVTGLTDTCYIKVKYSGKVLKDEFSEMHTIDCSQSQTRNGSFGCTNCQKTLSLNRSLSFHIRSCGLKSAPQPFEKKKTVITDITLEMRPELNGGIIGRVVASVTNAKFDAPTMM